MKKGFGQESKTWQLNNDNDMSPAGSNYRARCVRIARLCRSCIKGTYLKNTVQGKYEVELMLCFKFGEFLPGGA